MYLTKLTVFIFIAITTIGARVSKNNTKINKGRPSVPKYDSLDT
jgi:hypothetical protein